MHSKDFPSDICLSFVRQMSEKITHLSDERETAIGRLLLSKKKTTHCRDGNYSLQWQNNLFMSAYYDLYETPSPNGSEEKKSLHARICPKETYTQKEFVEHVAMFQHLPKTL